MWREPRRCGRRRRSGRLCGELRRTQPGVAEFAGYRWGRYRRHLRQLSFDRQPGQENLDGDAFGDVCDDDVDGDGLLNGVDNDDDNDGFSDTDEIIAATDPFDPDTDDDGIIDGFDRAPLSMANNFCFGMGTDVAFTLDLSTTLTCAVTGTITVQFGARVTGAGDLLLIAPTVTFDGTSQFRVDSTAKLTVIGKDPTAQIP